MVIIHQQQHIMKRLFVFCCLSVCLLAGSAGAWAAGIYYVDAISGRDNNSGLSPQQAWRSLEKVNSHVFKPGDRVRFRAGRIFEGQLKPQGSGSREQLITIESYGEGPKPRLQGNGVMPATLHLYNVSGWMVRDLDISNYGAQRKARRTGVMVEAKDCGEIYSVTLRGLDVHDVNGSLVKKEGGGAGIICSNGGTAVRSWFNGLQVDSCTIRRSERNGILINGYWSRQHWRPNLNVVIRGNLLEGIPGDGIVPTGCDGVLVEHNVMRDCPRLLPDGESAAGIWPWSCDNAVIQHNEVSDHKAPWDGQGFDSDWNCNNTLIQYNYSHDNEGGFLLVCDDGSVTRPYSAGNRGTVIRYNVSINDGFRTTGKHAGFSPVIHITGPVVNTQIYNNVIIVPDRRGMDSTIIEMGTWHGYADSTFFANNIFYAADDADYVMADSKRNYYKGNLFYGRHLRMPAGTNTVTADPLFGKLPEPGAAGFSALDALRLKTGSPAIGKGVPVTMPAKDIFGQPLSDEQVNIGVDGRAYGRFAPGGVWYDTAGDTINAHGGGLLYNGGKYYWFGEKRGRRASAGVAVYSSTDLLNWKPEGLALEPMADTASEITRGCVMERPKVIYNRKTKQYVMWFHLELKGKGYSAARAGVAVSDRITGPYRYTGSFRPNGHMSRDMTLFVDDDDKAYQVYAANENYDLRIVQLSADYLLPTRADSLLFRNHREAPALFRQGGTYYLITSGCTGWAPNKAMLHTASSPFGPWQPAGNPMEGQNADLTFGGQSTYVFPVAGKKGAFVYMGDQWNPGNLKNSRYHWLPVQWRNGLPFIAWMDYWKLSWFDKEQTTSAL